MAKSLSEQSQNMVVTISGKTVNRRKCRLVEGAYYEIGVDIVEIDGTFYRLNTGKVFQDYITKEWKKFTLDNLSEYRMVYTNQKGVVFIPISSIDLKLIKKYNLEPCGRRIPVLFNNKSINIDYYEKNAKVMYQLGILPKFAESPLKTVAPYDFTTDPFKRIERHIQNVSRFVDKFITSLCSKDSDFAKLHAFINGKSVKSTSSNSSSYPFSLTYNFTDNADYIRNILSKGPYTPSTPCDFHKEFYSFFDNYTYGIEYETAPGSVIPLEDLERLQWIPLRDGSLRTASGEGVEYVSSVLNSQNLIQNLIDFMATVYNEGCTTSMLCSIHVNIGAPSSLINNKTPKAVELYATALKIQDQIFELIAPYKSSHQYQKQLAKNYCKKLPNGGFFNMSYAEKEKFVNDFLVGGNTDTKFGIKTGVHPGDGGNKWDNAMRYYWINLLPTYFGKKKGVIEFRPLEPTKQFSILFCWTVLFKAIVQFALNPNNLELITSPKQKIDLQDIIDSTIFNPLLRQIMMIFVQTQKHRYINEIFHSRDTTSLSDSVFRNQLSSTVAFPSSTPTISPSNVRLDNYLEIYNRYLSELNAYNLKSFVTEQFQYPLFVNDLKLIGFDKFSTMLHAYENHHYSWLNLFSRPMNTSDLISSKIINTLKLPTILNYTYGFELILLVNHMKASKSIGAELSRFKTFNANKSLINMSTFVTTAKRHNYLVVPNTTLIELQKSENESAQEQPTF